MGDTRLADGRKGCPEVCLVGGTNAALWIRPADEIIARLGRDLDSLPHHRGIVVTSAGVMPPGASPETIRRVGEWVTGYPARREAEAERPPAAGGQSLRSIAHYAAGIARLASSSSRHARAMRSAKRVRPPRRQNRMIRPGLLLP